MAEVVDLPAVLCYGETEEDARSRAAALAYVCSPTERMIVMLVTAILASLSACAACSPDEPGRDAVFTVTTWPRGEFGTRLVPREREASGAVPLLTRAE